MSRQSTMPAVLVLCRAMKIHCMEEKVSKRLNNYHERLLASQFPESPDHEVNILRSILKALLATQTSTIYLRII